MEGNQHNGSIKDRGAAKRMDYARYEGEASKRLAQRQYKNGQNMLHITEDVRGLSHASNHVPRAHLVTTRPLNHHAPT